MCYTVTSIEEKSLKYAIHIAESPEEKARYRTELEEVRRKGRGLTEYHNVSGYIHPDLVTVTEEGPGRLQWGLVPFWVKSEIQAVSVRKSTLNARGETIFEKASFKGSAKNRRCVVLVQGFFEYHHANKKIYPFHIKLKSAETMLLAGLWDFNETIGRSTVSIVTTVGNKLLARIHNNPKLKEPRMPVILTLDEARLWINSATQDAKTLIKCYPDDDLDVYTVPRLHGKHAIGNIPESREEHVYDDLEFER